MSTGSKKAEPIRVGFILEVQDWLGRDELLPEPALRVIPAAGAGDSPDHVCREQRPESLTRNFDCVKIVRSEVLETESPAGLVRGSREKFSASATSSSTPCFAGTGSTYYPTIPER